MLTENEIRVLILKRVFALCDMRGRDLTMTFIRIDGEIRGLLAVLTGGKRHILSGNVTQIFDIAGIPWEDRADGGWNVPDEWCIANGCTVDGNTIRHPKLMEW